MLNSLIKLYDRDLRRLCEEIESYKNEIDLWKIESEINNSAGNICLHLIGNLNHYIGHQLGGTNYVRDRPLEFSDKNIPKAILIERVDSTRLMLHEVLPSISAEVLAQKHTTEFYEGNDTNEFFLIHLLSHLNYHLGQVNYHRRLIN